jgi:hypothetical protein
MAKQEELVESLLVERPRSSAKSIFEETLPQFYVRKRIVTTAMCFSGIVTFCHSFFFSLKSFVFYF